MKEASNFRIRLMTLVALSAAGVFSVANNGALATDGSVAITYLLVFDWVSAGLGTRWGVTAAGAKWPQSFRRSIGEWKVLKRYATAPWRQRDIFQSRQHRRNSWIAQSEPGSILFVGCPVVVAGSFHLALRMRNERRSVGESKLDLGPVTHRADRSNPRAGGGDDGRRDGEDPGPAG